MQRPNFLKWMLERPETPGWIKRYTLGPELIGVPATVADELSEGVMRAVASSWVAHPWFPDDALPYMGEERMLPRYPNESTENYKLRLHRAWRIWSQAGSRNQLISELEAYGYAGAFIVANNEWDGEDYPAWQSPAQDDEIAKWCRFWTYIPVGGHPYGDAGKFGAGRKFGDGLIFGIGGMTKQQVIDVKDIFKRFKAAHEQAVEIRFLITEGTFTEPTVWSGESVAIDLVNSI